MRVDKPCADPACPGTVRYRLVHVHEADAGDCARMRGWCDACRTSYDLRGGKAVSNDAVIDLRERAPVDRDLIERVRGAREVVDRLLVEALAEQLPADYREPLDDESAAETSASLVWSKSS